MIRPATIALATALLGCAQAAPAPPATPTDEVQSRGAMDLSGRLSRKGPSETSYWAVTDETGKVWEIVGLTPQLEARFRAIQNGPVTLRVERVGRGLFEQVRVLEVVRPAP